MKNFIAFIFFVIICNTSANCCSIEDKQDDKLWLAETLEVVQEKFTFSTHLRKEVENNAQIFSEVNTLIQLVLDSYPEDISLRIPIIRLLYIEGNHYLYSDRPVLAQKQLLKAKALAEKDFGYLEQKSAEEICQILSCVDKRLPSFYTMILHLLGKSYVLPWDMQNRLLWDEGKNLIIKSIEIREYIDAHQDLFADEIDNNPEVGNTHIFKRLLGFLYLENGELDNAESHFLELNNVNDELNHLMCLKQLLRVYQKKGQKADLLLQDRQELYKKAIDCSYGILKLLEQKLDINRISIYYSYIGELYQDPLNPYRDKDLALRFFQAANDSTTSELKSLQLLVHQGLSKVYFELSLSEAQKTKITEWDYSESASSDYLREINDNLTRKIVTYAEMGDIYKEKKEYIKAMGLYSNGLSLLKNDEIPELKIRLLGKMEEVEKKFTPNLQTNDIAYSTLLGKYGSKLDQIRRATDSMLDQKPVETIYAFISREYKQLVKEILDDILKQIEKPSKDFTLICGGSMSKETASQYSDLELALIIAEDCSDSDRRYFDSLATLLTLRLIAIGETPIAYLKVASLDWLTPDNSPSPRGFMLDPPQITHFDIETPKGFAAYLYNQSAIEGIPHLSCAFFNFSIVSGSSKLALDTQKELENLFTTQNRNRMTSKIFLKDFTRYDLKSQFDDNHQSFSIKHDFYRPFNILLYDVAFKYWKRDQKSPWAIVRGFHEDHLIDSRLAENTLKFLNEMSLLRLKVYSNSKQQQEGITTSLQHNGSSYYYVEEQNIENLYAALADFQDFTKTLDPIHNTLRSGLTGEQEVNFALVKLDLIEKSLRLELKNNPENLKAKITLGRFLRLIGRTQEARIFFQEILQTPEISIFDKANVLHQIGVTYLLTSEPLKAQQYLNQSVNLLKTKFDSEDPLLSNVNIDLGLALIDINQLEEGLNLIWHRVEIDTLFYGQMHPIIANNYFRLGCALEKIHHFHEAKSYFEKAIKIDTVMYGSRHLRLANYYRELANVLLHLKDPLKAKDYYKITVEIDRAFFGYKHPITEQDRQLLAAANISSEQNEEQVIENVLKVPHHNCTEETLAKHYEKSHPVLKAKHLKELALKASKEGDQEKATHFFKLSKIVSASYYQSP